MVTVLSTRIKDHATDVAVKTIDVTALPLVPLDSTVTHLQGQIDADAVFAQFLQEEIDHDDRQAVEFQRTLQQVEDDQNAAEAVRNAEQRQKDMHRNLLTKKEAAERTALTRIITDHLAEEKEIYELLCAEKDLTKQMSLAVLYRETGTLFSHSWVLNIINYRTPA